MRTFKTTFKTMPRLTATAAAALAAMALTPGLAAAAAPPTSGDCGAGQLCLWDKPGFKGHKSVRELTNTDIESCIALPEGSSAASLANRTGHPVTAYQSATCGETAEFQTYPGSGTWAPESPYRIRAFKIWER
ncbi:peptidase inhibitor family I36 protein [Streptomyces beihaiensis]|uniref:Peptidase inhibitor family I36 protein n=1 Tax=Streptomyces beihaiensis TaxID=2984495 RepID=A0ABT3TUA1_9ACTN|nr:peptidase inhibitor family I36 protein [Streptomyces beihaiensis]MCX3060012.1 peptidase inhibitor family I36 protein [Streptomyces beihaiensis]